MDERIPKDIQKIITRLELGYHINSTEYNTTIMRDVKNKAVNAYTEICGLNARSIDDKVELKLDFYLQHERQKKGIIKDVSILPDTQEARERVTRDLLEACS